MYCSWEEEKQQAQINIRNKRGAGNTYKAKTRGKRI
jgi:hypothetical protein